MKAIPTLCALSPELPGTDKAVMSQKPGSTATHHQIGTLQREGFQS